MIRTISIAVFGLALASAAQAMTFGPLHQSNAMITQVREGCGPGQVLVNGAWVARAQVRQARRCLRWNGSVCAQWE